MEIRLNKIMLLIVIGVMIMGILGSRALTSWREINEEKSVSLDEISEIQVMISSAAVHIIQTEASNEVKFHYYGKAMQEIKFVTSPNNKTVVAGEKRKHKALPLPEKMFLDIYIPKKYVNNFSIKISSGTVTMDDSFNFESFTYNTSSGILEAEQLTAEKISINTSSSNLNIKKIDTQEMEIYGSTSKISIDECIAKEANMGISTGSITLKNSSGNFDYKGSTGDVLIAYKEFENQNLNVETTVGNVTIELPSSAEFLLDAKTSTGGLKSEFVVNTTDNTDKKKIEGQIGTKNNKISLKTSTGSINILKNS